MQTLLQMEVPLVNLAHVDWLETDDSVLPKSLDNLFSSAHSVNNHAQKNHSTSSSAELVNVQQGHTTYTVGFCSVPVNIPPLQKRPASSLMTVDDVYVGDYQKPLKNRRIHSKQDGLTEHSSVPILQCQPVRSMGSKKNLQTDNPSLEELLASYPALRDELYGFESPRTTSFHFEMADRQVLHEPGITASNLTSLELSNMGNHLDLRGFSVKQPVKGTVTPPSDVADQALGHVMAERRRREKLSQQFIALSAIVPGLKKMDKASVLHDAVKYVKQLQDRIQVLEEQTLKKMSVAVHKDHPNGNGETALKPEIDVRIVDQDVLVCVHCCKQKGVLVKCVDELEKLQLSMVNANILSFSDRMLDLTFNGKLEAGCKLTAEDLVKSICALFN